MDENKKQDKMTKADRIIELRKVLKSYKEAGIEPEVTGIAKHVFCSRQTLYTNAEYRSILEEFEVGPKFKKPEIATKEYLLIRIESLEAELISKDNKSKKLQKKIADLEEINREVEKDLAKERSRLLRVQIFYLHLIEVYNGIAKRPIVIEPYDLQNINVDPLDVSIETKVEVAKTTPKIVPINKV